MKDDLDRLMQERSLDAVVIRGPDGLTGVNAPWNYMVGGQPLSGTIIKLQGAAAQLIFHTMERQQAEATGLRLVPSDRWNIREIAQRFPDPLARATEWYRQVFSDLGVRGRVGFYGTVEASSFLALTAALRAALPDLEITGEFEKDLISAARETKDAAEIERMADVGRRTCAVVQAVVDYIGAQHVEQEMVVDVRGAPVTIGNVKALIRRELDAQGLEAPEGTIFAQGRDAGIPHATGDEAAQLRLGQPIIFDLFPRALDSGYFHDLTRTFAIGYAPAELQQVYATVQEAFDAVVSALSVGERTKRYQDLACDVFRARGHRTIADEWPLEEGYVHSLGHGVGLAVHEDPGFPALVDRGETLTRGHVFTIEPGLYYPSRGLGVRIEDTFVCDLDGSFRSLTPFPRHLVIPMAS